MNAKSLIKRSLPPVLVDAMKVLVERCGIFGPPEWEYAPEGWERQGPAIRGWNTEEVVRAQKKSWDAFAKSLDGAAPLARSHEAADAEAPDYATHNTLMAYAYALALAAHRKDVLRMLDWGGGMGHYFLVSRALVPQVAIEYYCRDLPLLCEAGRQVLPDVHFDDNDDACFSRAYDFVLSSSSLQYSEHWRDVVKRLAGVCESYLLITRIPIVLCAGSFVVLQRAHRHGYPTEYLGWFWNRDELVSEVASNGMTLVREFLIDERPHVRGAPEQAHYRGFLFRSAKRG